MDKTGNRYGLVETQATAQYHRSRRMFYIAQGKLHIAKPALPYSHAQWLQEERLPSREITSILETSPRGFVSRQGDLYFYAGLDFLVTSAVEQEFFAHLDDLVSALGLNTQAHIFGGFFKEAKVGDWKPRKDYGQIGSYLKK